MPGFDIHDLSLNLKKNYFLEASAGTGKTYTIENCYVRLIQEGIPLDKILVVTFTRAATLELKTRIRSNMEKKGMFRELAALDEAKIFTIHGFCYHTLKDNALESGFPLNQVEESASPETLKRIFKDFLRTQLTEEEIHPRQLEKILAPLKGEIDLLFRELNLPSQHSGKSYAELVQEIQQEAKRLDFRKESLLEELLKVAPCFKNMCNRQKQLKAEVEEGLSRFAGIFSGETKELLDLPVLKMAPSHLLPSKGAYPEILKKLQERLIPLLEALSNREAILERMKAQFHLFLDHVCEKEDLFFYDGLLEAMHRCVLEESFAKKVRSHYQAVLIDEFQDTDSTQWDIFSTLFLHKVPLYLVGDPKQSIYRFRGADLYTYMRAKAQLGEEAYATLTQNFRSEPTLVEALNTLFSRVPRLITLPRTGETLPIQTISAALPPSDPGGIVFCKTPSEEAFFSYMVEEIEKLHTVEGVPYKSCAILVKDRYQARRFSSRCPLPYVLKRGESLLDSNALSILTDLLEAVYDPQDRSRALKALGGPLFCCTLEDLASHFDEKLELIYTLRRHLEERGILVFFQECVKHASFPTSDLYVELMQLIELIGENALGFEEYLPFLHRLRLEDQESELLKARIKSDEDAVQVMTLHVSKGLEFAYVFPVGLLSATDLSDEEERSEKMRQLYVALTRAKKNLYLPLTENVKAPLHYFLAQVLKDEPLDRFVQSNAGFSLCEVKEIPFLCAHSQVEKEPLQAPSYTWNFTPSSLYSYSSLAEKQAPLLWSEKKREVHEIPTGPETGILLHKIFEELDFQCSGAQLFSFVENQIQQTHLQNFAKEIEALILKTLSFPLQAKTGPFRLSEILPSKMIKEMEFVYPSEEPLGYIKGFMDLFFEHDGLFYILDWKSNFLESYTQESLLEAIDRNQYALQAELYATAAKQYLKLFECEERFGGSYYLFLRGLNAEKKEGVYFFPHS